MSIRQGYAHAFELGAFISDTDDLPFAIDAIYVGGVGNVAVQTTDGNSAVFTALPIGSILPIRAKRVLTTGTTATLLVGLWGH